jgi:hypothetical protein
MTGLVLILLISTFELFQDYFQHRIYSDYLEVLHAPPHSTMATPRNEEISMKDNLQVVRSHMALHFALIVIASICLLSSSRDEANKRHSN